MKIAIIGGGASGLITAYLLHEQHEVTIYEKEAVLGGNVRTLNKNVPGTTLPKNLAIENGVLGFSKSYYPNFHRLMQQLDMELLTYKPSLSLFANGRFYPARLNSLRNIGAMLLQLGQPHFIGELIQLGRSQSRFKNNLTGAEKKNAHFQDYQLDNPLFEDYMRGLFMLSFSTPFAETQHLPQSLLTAYVRSLPNSRWSFVRGGVYAYMEKIVSIIGKDRLRFNTEGLRVHRHADHVVVNLNGNFDRYDKVVIATTPGAVASILTAMSDRERTIFGGWQDRTFTTLAHTDNSLYGQHQSVRKTPMDLFLDSDQQGYNTYQNTVYRIPGDTSYHFAYGLEHRIPASAVLHRADHTVPAYDSTLSEKVSLIESLQGEQHTFYTGAYLGNGLQEGAVTSANKIAKRLHSPTTHQQPS